MLNDSQDFPHIGWGGALLFLSLARYDFYSHILARSPERWFPEGAVGF